MAKKETILEVLAKWAKSQPDKGAWTFLNGKMEVEESYTYKELDNATSALSSYLLDECNLKQGDKVLLVFVPGLAFTTSLVACIKAGLIGVPVYPPDPTRFGKDLYQFTTIQQDCGAKVALTHGTYSFAKTIGGFKSVLTFAKKECEWPSLTWIDVDSVLKAGKTFVDNGRVNPPCEIAFLQYTSGSTSAPKGVMVSQQNISDNCMYVVRSYPTDVAVRVTASWLPQYHDMGLIGTYLGCLYAGSSGYYMSPITFLRDPLSYLRLLAKYQVSISAAPNFAFALMLRKLQEAKPEVRKEILSLVFPNKCLIFNGAEPINAKVLLEFVETFKNINPSIIGPCYGLAEFTLIAAGHGKGRVQVDKAALEAKRVVVLDEGLWTQPYKAIDGATALVSCGVNVPEHAKWAIVDPDTGKQCPADRVGEVWLSGQSKTMGYYNRPEVNKEAFHAKLAGSDVEWLRTGDAAFIYKDELYFCGRIKDLIIINGLNYYPQDIERIAEDCHDALRPGCSATFAVDQEGETECAVLVTELKENIPKSQYAEIVDKIVAAVSREQGLFLSGVYLLKTRSVPKTTSGKITRAGCKKAYLEGSLQVLYQRDDLEVPKSAVKAPVPAAAPVPICSLEEVKAKISKMVLTIGHLEDVRTDAVLLDLGLSSVAVSELSGMLSTEFGVRVRPSVLMTNPTIDDVAARVVELMTAKAAEESAPRVASTETLRAPVHASGSSASHPFFRDEAFIAGWGTATPYPVSTERYLEVERRERKKFGQSDAIIGQMESLVKASKVVNRYSCHPFYLPEGKTPEDYPEAVGGMTRDIFTPNNFIPNIGQRMDCYHETTVAMSVTACERAVVSWGGDRKKITHVLSTSTTGWHVPGVAMNVIKQLGLSLQTQKEDLPFNGCMAGALLLRAARDKIRAGDAEAVLIVAAETSTVHYDWSFSDAESLVGQSLFADGAAAFVLAKEGLWRFNQTGVSVIPDSMPLLGFRTPFHEHEHAYIMTLSKLMAPSLNVYFTKGHGKEIIKKLYTPGEEKPALVIHPGGPRILQAVGDVFFELGWPEDALEACYDVFANHGNLGCVAMLTVLAQRLSANDIKEDKLITMAFGPGVTVEWATLERATRYNSNAAMLAAAMADFPPASTAVAPAAQVQVREQVKEKKAVVQDSKKSSAPPAGESIFRTAVLALLALVVVLLIFIIKSQQQLGAARA